MASDSIDKMAVCSQAIGEKVLYTSIAHSDMDSREYLIATKEVASQKIKSRYPRRILVIHGIFLLLNIVVLGMYKLNHKHPLGFHELETCKFFSLL